MHRVGRGVCAVALSALLMGQLAHHATADCAFSNFHSAGWSSDLKASQADVIRLKPDFAKVQRGPAARFGSFEFWVEAAGAGIVPESVLAMRALHLRDGVRLEDLAVTLSDRAGQTSLPQPFTLRHPAPDELQIRLPGLQPAAMALLPSLPAGEDHALIVIAAGSRWIAIVDFGDINTWSSALALANAMVRDRKTCAADAVR